MLIILASVSAVAQSVDSTKAKQPTNSLSKYQQPSQFGVKSTPNPSPIGQPDPNMVKKSEEKRVNSSYQYENGRVVGGKTTLQLGKKKN